jgi:hypothetical protein
VVTGPELRCFRDQDGASLSRQRGVQSSRVLRWTVKSGGGARWLRKDGRRRSTQPVGCRVAFIVFDAPDAKGTWDRRIATVTKKLRCAFAAAVPWKWIDDVEHLAAMFRAVGESAGEGLMLRCPVAVGYTPGRSERVLKLTKDPVNGSVYPGRLVIERRMQLARRAA